MPHRTDHSDRPGALPVPELNPLVNPILAQNMGRWAEVYFTSPPEKREERVLELLRELEAEGSESSAEVARAAPQDESSDASASSLFPDPQPPNIRCDSCGHENPGAQRFCGMCGTKLESPRAAHVEAHSNGFPAGWEETSSSAVEGGELPSSRSERQLDSIRDKLGWALDPEPTSRSPRFYIGAGLAIVILALAYMAWRSAQSASLSRAPQSPPAETAAPNQRDAAPPASNPDSVGEPQQDVSSTRNQSASTNDSGKPVNPVAATTAQKTSAQPESSVAGNAQEAQSQSNPGNGSEELAIAHKYLDGTSGAGRDSSEAAKWLWQSVAKHNSDATLELSDLYLRGDGVPKNCEQAQVLLEAAASKGSKDAAERLLHLQAFGCQ